MQSHGLKVSRYVTAGMQMEMKDNVVLELLLHSVLQLESSLKNTEIIQMVGVVGAECHGSCLSLGIPLNG